MHVDVVFRHVGPSDALRRHAERKLDGRLARLVGDEGDARVVLSVEKSRHRAEVALTARRLAVVAVEETDDMYAAIDLVVDKLERQVREARERRREPRRG